VTLAPPATPKAKVDSRKGLKHVGGYVSKEVFERFSALRTRLDIDNSALLAEMIEERYRKELAKKAFA